MRTSRPVLTSLSSMGCHLATVSPLFIITPYKETHERISRAAPESGKDEEISVLKARENIWKGMNYHVYFTVMAC